MLLFKIKKSFMVFLLVFVLTSMLTTDVIADPNELYIDIAGVVGNTIYNRGLLLSASDLAKMIEEEIGKDNYQQVTITINSCCSGGAAESMPPLLSGVFNIITSCSTFQYTRHRPSGGTFIGFTESFWDSVINNPVAPVDSHFENGRKGTPLKTNEQLEKEYNDYRNRVIEANKIRQQQGKKPLPVPPPWGSNPVNKMKGQDPQNKQSDSKPGTKKIAVGDESNHAVIIVTDPSKRPVDNQLVDKVKQALGPDKAKYNSISELTPCTQQDIEQWKKDSTKRDDMATEDNIRKKLKELKTVMNTKEHLFITIISHGTNVNKSVRTSENTGQNQGAIFNNLNRLDVIGDEQTALCLGEGVVDDDGTIMVDHCWYDRWSAPALVIQTIEETLISGEPVEVSINGLRLTDIVLEPGGAGFHYLPMDDVFLRTLLNTTDYTQGFNVSFNFASDYDSFKLATIGDKETLYLPSGYYGMSFALHLDDATAIVPEPATLMLLVIGGLIMKRKNGSGH